MRLRKQTPRERQIARERAAEKVAAAESLADVLTHHTRLAFLAGASFGLFIGTAMLLAAAAWVNAAFAGVGAICCVLLMVTEPRWRY